MFKKVKAENIKEYLEAIPHERKELVLFLDDFIQKAVPKLKAHFAYNMLGYGSFSYKNHKKEIVDWPVISLANQKNYVSIYVCALDNGQYLAEKYQKDLGKVSVGRSCIRLKKLEDVNLQVLKTILEQAAKNPGLVS